MHSKNLHTSAPVIPLMLFSSSIFAEVSDKIVQPNTMLVSMFVFSLIAFVLCKKWPFWFPLIALVTLFFSSQGIATVLDEYIGPAAIREQGVSYAYIAYTQFGLVASANLLGTFLGFKSRVKKHA